MFEFINKMRILFFISLMILSVHGLEISILNVLSDFKCKTQIMAASPTSGNKIYYGAALKPYHYEAFYPKSTVIAYIVDETRFEEIANPDALAIRMGIAQELGRNNHEIVVFGIENCQDNEFGLISEFLYDIIRPHPNQTAFEILTMGEEPFDRIYLKMLYFQHPLGKYIEKSQIYNGTLQEHLRRSFLKLANRSKRPDPSNIKEVRFFENLSCRRWYPNESMWPIVVQSGEYVPASFINLNQQEYNILKRNKNMNIHILVVSGKDYVRLTTKKQRPVPWFEEIQEIMNKMRKNNEMLYIMGCFNFDWSEIGLVSQIILAHSTIPPRSKYNFFNVFTAGLGMFDTFFHNPDEDSRKKLQQSSNNDLMQFISKYQGGTMKKRTIEIINLNAANVITYEIVLSNGRYEIENYYFITQYLNVTFAFIVIDSTEMYDQNVFLVAQTHPYVKMLQSNGIELFVIKLNNFELYDLHIVPEWIESIRGVVPPNRISLLGGGSCNTIFQLVSPEYQITYSLHNVANEMLDIRNGFVATAGDKGIILANINAPNLWIQGVPMHTINGFYDPVAISEIDMISTADNTKILFLIMNADKFINMINAVPEWRPTLITDFRQRIANDYPLNQWRVYLVGLDNFAEKDFHLFAEFVKTFTNDNRPLREFVYTFGDGIYQAMYAYRDTLPFYTTWNMPMAVAFNDFFHAIDVILALNEE